MINVDGAVINLNCTMRKNLNFNVSRLMQIALHVITHTFLFLDNHTLAYTDITFKTKG